MTKHIRTNLVLFLAVAMSLCLSGCSKAARAQRYLDRADKQFAAGEFEKAKIEYMNVLRSGGPSAKAYMRIGEIWSEQGAPLRAGPFLANARKLEGDNIENNMRLARILVSLGQKKEAREIATATLQQAPGNGEALVVLSQAVTQPDEIAAAEQALTDFPEKNALEYHLAVAAIAALKRDMPAAEKAIDAALAADPKSPDAHATKAIFHLSRNDRAAAEKEMKTAAELAPPRSGWRVKYAELLVSLGRDGEAVEYLKTNAKETPDFLPFWNGLARIALAQKKYDDIPGYLENVLARDSENVDARMAQAELWLARGETVKAREQLAQLDTTYSGVPKIKFQLARAYLQENNVAQATAQVEQAIAVAPDFADAVMLLAELQIRTGKASAAIEPLERLTKTQPAELRARRLLADAYRAVGRLDAAADLFREEIQKVPDFAQPHLLLGIALREQKKNAEAREEFAKAAEMEPKNPAPVEQLVDMDLAEKNFQAASERARAFKEKVPDSGAAYLLEGKIAVVQQQWDAAEKSLSKAIELNPNLEAAYRLLISGYVATGKLPDAVARLEQILKINPNHQSALLTLAMIYSVMKEYEKSRDTYERLLTLGADSAVAMNNLAYLYSEQVVDLDRALELATKARDAAPDNASVADTLGWVLYKRGDYQKAATILSEAAGKMSDNATVQFHYGMAAYMMGQSDVARAALEKAVNAPGDFAEKEEARRRLSTLREGGAETPALSVADLEKKVKEQPDDVLAWTRLAEQYEKTGESQKASDAYGKAFALNPRLLPAVRKLVELNIGPLKNPAKAFEFAKAARQLATNDPDVVALFGRAAYAAGNFQQAYDVLQSAARQKADDPALQHAYAWAAYSIGREAEAEGAMRQVTEKSPGGKIAADAKTFLGMLAAARSAEAAKSAEPQMKAALAADPNYVPALMVQGTLQSQGGDTAGAIATYQRILDRFPDFAPGQKRLAGLYASDPAQQAKAYELASNARKALPDDPELAALLGRLSYERKEFRRAVQLLQESEKARPLGSSELFYLGMSQVQLNDKTAGAQSLQKALSAGLSGTAAEEAKRVLAETASP